MESLSVFDIFKIGVGPSSSHTMGPWRAAQMFVQACATKAKLHDVVAVRCDLYGSLAKTGKGHGTDIAVMLGLGGVDPVTCDTSRISDQIAQVTTSKQLLLDGKHAIHFNPKPDIYFHFDAALPQHPNGMTFTATLASGEKLSESYYSIGGGFVIQDEASSATKSESPPMPFRIESSAAVLDYCREHQLSIADAARQNELVNRTAEQLSAGLQQIWQTMRECIYRGCLAEGILPGGLEVVRRAGKMSAQLLGRSVPDRIDDWQQAVAHQPGAFRDVLKWVSTFALAVNEENASFGRVVTAPTNGAAGVVPAVLMYYLCFCQPPTGDAAAKKVEDFLLTAAVIGMMFKKGATLSAAMGGCQAEIGVSSAMSAAGLCEVLGGSPAQALMAAEIAMEHHLGLTCDPVGGLVQIPCIERNAMGAVKAITACNLALVGDPAQAKVSLDAVIRSMWATAQDMNAKYKETSEGGLAIQIPVNVSEC